MKLSFDDRRQIRDLARKRVALRYELDMASIERHELMEQFKWKTLEQRSSSRLVELEAKIDTILEELAKVSNAAVAKTFNCRDNTISSITTAVFR